MSSASLKTSALAASLPSGRVAAVATCTTKEPAIAAAAAAGVEAEAQVERVSIGVGNWTDTATKGIAVDFGCDGGDRCANGKGVEALGVLLQYLVFDVSIVEHLDKQ